MNKAQMIPTMFYRQSNVLLFTLFIYSSNFVYKNNLPLFAGHICVPLLIVFDLLQINFEKMSFLSRCTKSSQEDVLEMMSFIDEPRRKVSAESY